MNYVIFTLSAALCLFSVIILLLIVARTKVYVKWCHKRHISPVYIPMLMIIGILTFAMAFKSIQL